jgi:hypothetical protein
MTETVGSSDLDSSLPGFLSGDPIAIDIFFPLAQRYLLKLANKLAPELPVDIREEIVSQTYVNLLGQSGKRFDPTRGQAKAFLRGLLLNAVRQVRANYCPPGRQTRLRGRAEKSEFNLKQSTVTISLDVEVIELVAPQGALAIEASCDAHTILDSASPLVASGLKRICFYGDTRKEAAEILCVPLWQLKNEILAFQRQWQLAA